MKNLICIILILLATASNIAVVNENEKTKMPTAIKSETVSQIIIEETEETEPEVQEIEEQEKAVVPKTETVETSKPTPTMETPAHRCQKLKVRRFMLKASDMLRYKTQQLQERLHQTAISIKWSELWTEGKESKKMIYVLSDIHGNLCPHKRAINFM